MGVPDKLKFKELNMACIQSTYFNPAFPSECSFAVTENYVIMMHWPATIKPMKLVMSQCLLPALSWDPELGTDIRVIDRKKGGRGLIARYRRVGLPIRFGNC